MFPRGGNNSNYSWTADEPIVFTKTKSYSAFEYHRLLGDLLGISSIPEAMLQAVMEDKLLQIFDSPGVNTFIVAGVGIPTIDRSFFDEDFIAGHYPGLPNKLGYGDGDGVVPRRSSDRSMEWSIPLNAQGKKFIYTKYKGLSHGLCAKPNSTVSEQCFNDVLALLLNKSLE